MISFYLDSDVLLDLCLEREAHAEMVELFLAAKENKVALFTSSSSFLNVAYFFRKEQPEHLYTVLENIRVYVQILENTKEAIDKALAAQWKDFEDAVQYFSCEQARLSFFVTRNLKDFINHGKIEVVTPKNAVEILASIE